MNTQSVQETSIIHSFLTFKIRSCTSLDECHSQVNIVFRTGECLSTSQSADCINT